MTHWTQSPTTALANAKKSLKTVENLLSAVKEGQGKPSAKERAIFAAGVVFLYGVWENFVEQLAIELVKGLSAEVKPERIPEQVRKQLEKKALGNSQFSQGGGPCGFRVCQYARSETMKKASV